MDNKKSVSLSAEDMSLIYLSLINTEVCIEEEILKTTELDPKLADIWYKVRQLSEKFVTEKTRAVIQAH